MCVVAYEGHSLIVNYILRSSSKSNRMSAEESVIEEVTTEAEQADVSLAAHAEEGSAIPDVDRDESSTEQHVEPEPTETPQPIAPEESHSEPTPPPPEVPAPEPRPCADDVRLFRQFTVTPMRGDFPRGVNCRIDFPVPVPTSLKVFVREILHLQIIQFDPFIVRGYVHPAHMNLVIDRWRAQQGI